MSDSGRPSKLTPEVREKIVQALQLCNRRKDAADYAGVNEATLRRWMARGKNPNDEEYAAFRQAVIEAEAKAQILAMGCVAKAIRAGDWKAAAWYLERKAPELYSPRSSLFDPYRTLELLEEAGLIKSEEDRDRALTALAQAGGKIDQPAADEEDDLDQLDLSEEQREILFGVLHAAKRNARVVDSEPLDEE